MDGDRSSRNMGQEKEITRLIGFLFQAVQIRFELMEKKIGVNKVLEVVPYSKTCSD